MGKNCLLISWCYHADSLSHMANQSKHPGADAVKAEYRRLMSERENIAQKLAKNTAALQDCAAAGRLFGVPIELPPDLIVVKRPSPSLHLLGPRNAPDQTIRDMVLKQLEGAGEKGIKAQAIQRTIEGTLGRKLHYKTVGMTLYRLSVKGEAHRGGHFIWYFGPNGPKAKTPAS